MDQNLETGVSMRNELVLIRHSDEPADDRVFTYARMNGLVPVEKFPFLGIGWVNQRKTHWEQLFMAVCSMYLKRKNTRFCTKKTDGLGPVWMQAFLFWAFAKGRNRLHVFWGPM